jgi:hypothetical protein
MKTLLVVVGVFVVLVLLVSSGIIGGSFCLKGVGCLYSTDQGAAIDDRQTVTISTP